MQKIEFICPIRSGKIPPHVSQSVRDVFGKMDGKTAKITIQQQKKHRSLSQNAFYFSAVVPVIRDMFFEGGQMVDEQVTHEYLKRYVGNLTRTIATPDGKIETVTRSSTELSTIEWEVFIEQIRAFAAQWNVSVPFPREKLTTGVTNG